MQTLLAEAAAAYEPDSGGSGAPQGALFCVPAATSLQERQPYTLKCGDTFAVFDHIGDAPSEPGSPEGLYHCDTRHLSKLHLTIEAARPMLLSSTLRDDNATLTCDLTNPDLFDQDGRLVLAHDLVHVRRTRLLWNATCFERLAVHNFDGTRRRLRLSVAFAADCIGEKAVQAVAGMADGDVLMLENTRFHAEEEKNDPDFVNALAANGDVYVNDAFSAAHRAHASTEGLAHHMPAFAGRAMQAELEALEKGLGNPSRPVIAIVGGAKVSTKIDLLEHLIDKVDALVIGGGMANTFLHAQGHGVGQSLCEKDLADTARRIMAKAEQGSCAIILPVDAVVAWHFEANAPHRTYGVDAIPDDGMILDAGQQSFERIRTAIEDAATLVWNGPLGAFEMKPFDEATMNAAHFAATLTKAGNLVSVAGGGDTVAALNQAGIADDFTYVSTAGGAFLEWMEGKELPGVAVLKKD